MVFDEQDAGAVAKALIDAHTPRMVSHPEELESWRVGEFEFTNSLTLQLTNFLGATF
jgi:hypothetical protein